MTALARVKLERPATLFAIQEDACYLALGNGEMLRLDLSIVKELEAEFLSDLPPVVSKTPKVAKLAETSVILSNLQVMFDGSSVRLMHVPCDQKF